MKQKALFIPLIFVLLGLVAGFFIPFPAKSDGFLGFYSLPADVNSTENVLFFKAGDKTNIAYRKINPPENTPSNQKCLVFLHALSVHSGWLTDFARKISETGTTIYLPDLRAHGLSEGRVNDIPGMEVMVSDLEKMIQIVRKEQPDSKIMLGGHCLGCKYITNYLYKNSQNDIESLVFLVPFFTDAPNIHEGLYYQKTGRMFSCYPLRLLFPKMLSIHANWHHALSDRFLRTDYSLSFVEMKDFDRNLENRLKGITQPLIWIQGENDIMYKKAGTNQMFETIATSEKELYFLKETGHMDVINNSTIYIKQWISKR
ncbi:alpha/beta fold hydrolase [Marinilabiliaceae bacterium JC017]|nr:alpha/beta fold hydrolase [Marinilabiliaceae bacterium JC017]